jgi:hypothetical protein
MFTSPNIRKKCFKACPPGQPCSCRASRKFEDVLAESMHSQVPYDMEFEDYWNRLLETGTRTLIEPEEGEYP